MDENTKLILGKAAKVENWEDREKATDDVEVLKKEFQKRLYPRQSDQAARQNNLPEKTDK